MSEDTNTTTPQAGGSGNNPLPQAGNTTTPEPQAGDGQENISLDEARKLRSEAANLRKRLKAYEEAEARAQVEKEKAKEADLTENQRLKKQYEDLQAQHSASVEAQFEERINNEIERQAARAGINPKHLDRISRLLDWEEIDIDEQTGRAKNIADLVSQLVKDMPELLGKTAPTSGGATNPSRSQTDGNSGEITSTYVADVMSGKIKWESLTPERRSAILQWQSRNAFRF